MQSTANLDRAAAALSLACIVHCVALPLVAIALPFIAAFAEAEWIHALLAVLAVGASATVVASSATARTPGFLLPGCLGMVLVIGALFAERFGADETLPTIIGGVLIAAAHIRRLLGKG